MMPANFRSPLLLKKQFPEQFVNGHRVDTSGFWCKQCMTIAHPDTVHGPVSRIVESGQQLGGK